MVSTIQTLHKALQKSNGIIHVKVFYEVLYKNMVLLVNYLLAYTFYSDNHGLQKDLGTRYHKIWFSRLV